MINKFKTMIEPAPTVTTPVLTHTALGTFQDTKTGQWVLAELRYNPETGETGEFKAITNEEGNKDAINYRLKIALVEKGILT